MQIDSSMEVYNRHIAAESFSFMCQLLTKYFVLMLTNVLRSVLNGRPWVLPAGELANVSWGFV
jgi:hypothetical protein